MPQRRNQPTGQRQIRLLLAAAAVGLLLSSCSPDQPPPEVSAAGETLRGQWVGEAGDVASFRGIPFAAAPLGDLRWRAPQPAAPRAGVQLADQFAAACIQGPDTTEWYADIAEAFGAGRDVAARPLATSEDCLYLNIWTPQLMPSEPLPVMVFVHGGANVAGWSYEPNYLGEKLAGRGVVVVSIAYRLGPLGFFAHPALQAEADEPVANFALLDIAEALRWVSAHIGAFGGDGSNITGFGESAGAGNLLDVALLMEEGGTLLPRVIAQSTGGSLDKRPSLAQAQATAVRLLAHLGVDADASARQLREIPAQQLVDAVPAALPDMYFEAVVDGRVVKQQPLEALMEGRGAGLELVIGTNADEWLMYLEEQVSEDDLQQWIRQQAPEFAGSLHSLVADTDPRKALDRLNTARDMLCPSRFIAGTSSQQGGQGFVYYFTRQRSGPGGATLGVYHGAELPYVFGQHDAWLPTEAIDLELTDALMDYWVGFARFGAPSSPGRTGWPVYTNSRAHVMELGDEVRISTPHDQDLCRYLGPRPGPD